MQLIDWTYLICVVVLLWIVVNVLIALLLIAHKFKWSWVTTPLIKWIDKIFYKILNLILGKGVTR